MYLYQLQIRSFLCKLSSNKSTAPHPFAVFLCANSNFAASSLMIRINELQKLQATLAALIEKSTANSNLRVARSQARQLDHDDFGTTDP